MIFGCSFVTAFVGSGVGVAVGLGIGVAVGVISVSLLPDRVNKVESTTSPLSTASTI